MLQLENSASATHTIKSCFAEDPEADAPNALLSAGYSESCMISIYMVWQLFVLTTARVLPATERTTVRRIEP